MVMAKDAEDYFIGVLPPKPIYDQVLALKHYFKEHFQSKASLNSPPHITLHMPFQWKEKREGELIETLFNFSTIQSPFELQLKNFSCFEPRVIYIDVERQPRLSELQHLLHKTLQKELNIFNANYKDYAFHPHMTVAFRDLKKQNFYKAWEEFKTKTFNASFKVEEVALLKHDGKIWQAFRSFSFLNNE